MKTTIALSVDAIVDDILAETALRHYMDRNDPHLLNRDRKPALARVIRSAIAALAVDIGASLTADADSDIIALGLDLPASASAAAMRGLLQQAVTASVTATAYAGADEALARRFEKLHATALYCIRGCLAASEARIAPSRF